MTSFATRILMVVLVAASVSLAATILLIQKHGMTWKSYGIRWNIVSVTIFTIILPATLGVTTDYTHWHPRYGCEATPMT
jgi:hypothetical protein